MWICKCKIIFYKWKNYMLNHIITSYTCFCLANIKKIGYKLHLLVKYPKLWIYKCKINFYKCKNIFYKWKNDMLNHIITSYTCFYLASIKKSGYKLHLLVKTQNCEFTSVKSTFTSVNWLVLKKYVMISLVVVGFVQKSPNICIKIWIFGAIPT